MPQIKAFHGFAIDRQGWRAHDGSLHPPSETRAVALRIFLRRRTGGTHRETARDGEAISG